MPIGVSQTAALEARRPIVPESVDDAAERLGAGVQQRAARVVLEPGQRQTHAGLELALEQDVADHPRLAGDGLVRKERRARHERPVATAIPTAQELVAAADGEHGDAMLVCCLAPRRSWRPDRVR